MVAFGAHLAANMVPEWRAAYVDYDKLKQIIDVLQKKEGLLTAPASLTQGPSLTVPPPTNAAGQPDRSDSHCSLEEAAVTNETFLTAIEAELRKVQEFTRAKMNSIRARLVALEGQRAADLVNQVSAEADSIGDEFLTLEKFVNLNFTGFHKILKKHDKNLPHVPCHAFYMSRLHSQTWVKGDYSDVIVRLSGLYSRIRGEKEEQAAPKGANQAFVRKTTKYWVKQQDISDVKLIVSKHLPVHLQEGSSGETDAQLANSVYLDNAPLELYHDRLDRSQGSIALRLRWYGTGEPNLVFVERKKHHDGWTGEVSVKERFTVAPDAVPSLLSGTYDVEAGAKAVEAKGRGGVEAWRELVGEVMQTINSKQLTPTCRTQYMRTAFQLPHDASVRVSLDTNLTMLAEHGADPSGRWYRDPNVKVPRGERAFFPHAVLEVKLQLVDYSDTPAWLRNLIKSGMVQEVHKFSKYIHGCAVLMTDDVRAVPYWIDDATLRASIEYAAGGRLPGNGPAFADDANAQYDHLLPNKARGPDGDPSGAGTGGAGEAGAVRPKRAWMPNSGSRTALEDGELEFQYDDDQQPDGYFGAGAAPAAAAAFAAGKPRAGDRTCCGGWLACLAGLGSSKGALDAVLPPQRVEPKLLFAAERTFLHWLHMAVFMTSGGTAIIAYFDDDFTIEVWGLTMLALALIVVVYAVYQLTWRVDLIRRHTTARWDDTRGVAMMASTVLLVLCVTLFVQVTVYVEGGRGGVEL